MPIDPIEFGKVLARLDAQDHQIEAISKDVKRLLELANSGRGSIITLTSLGAFMGAIVSLLAHYAGSH